MAYGDPDSAYLVGLTASFDFPTTPQAFQPTLKTTPFFANGTITQTAETGFVTKIGTGPTGKVLTRSVLTIGSPQGNQSGQATLLATVTPLTVAPAEPILTGTVTFYNNGSPMGAPVPVGTPITTASLTTSLPSSIASLGCSYSGDAYYANSDCVLLPDFALVLASPTVTVQRGQHITTSATLVSINSFADTISVACSTVPTHLQCQFTPTSTSLAANGSATLSLYLDSAPALALNRRVAPTSGQLALLLLPVSLLASRRLRRMGGRYGILCCILALSLSTLAISGCGREVYPYALPAGTYTIPITAIGKTTGVTHTVQLTLVVTP